MNAPPYAVAAVMSSGDLERFYSGLSVLVSRASDGARCAALGSYSALGLLLDEDLLHRASEPDATPSLSWAGRDTFARSLLELRDTALGLEGLDVYACSAAIETMSLTAADVEQRLSGVMSTPRFLREVAGAELLFI